MLKSNERLFNYFDLTITAKGKKIPDYRPLALKDLIDMLQKYIDSGETSWNIKNKTQALYISDIKTFSAQNVTVLLINKCDKTAADPAFSDPEKKKRRVVHKLDGEGQETSSHVFLKLTESDTRENSYLCLIEQVPGLSSNLISAYFNRILRRFTKLFPEAFTRNHPDGSKNREGLPKTFTLFHKAELFGHISESLKEDIENGTIRNIELITEQNKDTNFDDGNFTKEVRKVIQLVPSKDKVISKRMALVSAICHKASKEDYELTRVKFTTQENIRRSITLKSASHNENLLFAGESLYTKKAIITSDASLFDSSYEKISDLITLKILRLM